MKRTINIITVVASILCLFTVLPVLAIPMSSGSLYTTGGNISVTMGPSEAGYTSNIMLKVYNPSTTTSYNYDFSSILSNRMIGTTYNLGEFDAGLQLFFGIYITNTGEIFSMGDGSSNPDGLVHATVAYNPTNAMAIVGFEDVLGGGDQDFNDVVINVNNVTDTAPVPEPSTLVLIGLGFAGLAFARKKQR